MPSNLFTFWSGPLGYVERLCIASILEAGHPLDIYTYDMDLQIPQGASLRNAEEIVPQDRVVAHETGSLALFSDIFRYEGLLREVGTWIDLDMLLLKPVDAMGEYIVGWQDPHVINGAILRLPPKSACLTALLEICHAQVVVPPQWPTHRKVIQRVRGAVGAAVPLQKLEWGAIGPLALTRLMKQFHLLHRCQPMDVFYPYAWQNADIAFDPDSSLVRSVLTSSTRAIHLWNDRIKTFKSSPPPRGSFIDEMCERFRVSPGVPEN